MLLPISFLYISLDFTLGILYSLIFPHIYIYYGEYKLSLSCYAALIAFVSNFEYSRFSKVVRSLYKSLDLLTFILLL